MPKPAKTTDVRASPASRWQPWQCALLLAVAVAVTYFPGLPAPLIYDDEPQLRKVSEALSRPLSLWADVRPIGYWSFAANMYVHGLRPTLLRATNIAIHLGSALLIFWLARHALKRRSAGAWRSALVTNASGIALSMALLWAIHPLPSGAVTYIIQRFESLMSFFLLLALVGLWKGARSPRGQRHWPWYVLAIVAAWLGAATKEVMVAFPLIALLIDRAYLARTWRELWHQRGLVHLGFLGCWLVIYLTHKASGGDYSTAGFGGEHTASPWEYLRTQPAVILRYLQLVFWPDRLVLDYGWSVASAPWQIYGLGSVVVGLLVASCWLWFTRPRVGAIALSFFLLLALTSSFYPLADVAFEYRMYLASATIIILVVVAGFALLQRLPKEDLRKKVAFATVAIVVTLLAMRTYARNKDYRDPLRIWLQCAEFNPQNGRAEMNSANRLRQAGRLEEALAHYAQAVRVYKGFDQGRLHLSYGLVLQEVGRREEAAKEFALAAADPPPQLDRRLLLVERLRQTGQHAEAVRQLDWLLQDVPWNTDHVLPKLTWILATSSDDKLRKPKRAKSLAEQMLKWSEKPSARTLDAAAAAFAAAGDFSRAIELAQQAEELARPTDAALADEIAKRCELYRKEEPFLER